MIGAAHAIEIPFVFDLVEDQRLHVFVGADAPKELARATHEAWVAFARDGRTVGRRAARTGRRSTAPADP